MAKKSQTERPRHEREQAAGCIWGLINKFDLRNSRPTKWLLADRKGLRKQAIGIESSRIEVIVPQICEEEVVEAGARALLLVLPSDYGEDTEESKTLMNDVARTSVKELMEEEMCNEELSTNKLKDSDEICLEQIDLVHGVLVGKNHKKIKRTRSKSWDMDVSDIDCVKPDTFHKVPEIKNSENLDWETILEELSPISDRTLEFQNYLNMPCIAAVDEKLVAAIKLVIRMSNSQHFQGDEKSFCSGELVDALQTLSLNKGLFLKLLKDPNFAIFKKMQKLEDAWLEKDQTRNSLPESNLSQDKQGSTARADETGRRKHNNFFRRRSKSMESFPVAKDDDSQSSSKIVVMKPGPDATRKLGTDTSISSISLQSEGIDNAVQSARNMSQFSFSKIKRKIWHAMGKERQGISTDTLMHKSSLKHQNGNNGDKGPIGENLYWSSPNRDHFYTEKFAKSSIKKAELDDKSKVDSSRYGSASLYIEAKKHLSEILNNEEEKSESMSIQLPKSLGRILSLPDYNGSPRCNSIKQGDDVFIMAQMKLSPRDMVKDNICAPFPVTYSNNSSPSAENLERQPQLSSNNCENKVHSPHANDNVPTPHDQEYVQYSSSRVVELEQMTDLRPPEDDRVLDDSSEFTSNLITGDIQSGDAKATDRSDSLCFEDSSGCIKLDVSGEDQTSFSPVSPRSSMSREDEDLECSIDKMERPSPVSVLATLFTDDEISPTNRMSQSVNKETQPIHIHFKEQSSANDRGICSRISLEDEESAFEYIEAVLLGSGLNWDEFLLRWLSLYEILDSSLFEEVELFSSRSRDDQKLFFDSANEVLKEVSEDYFSLSSVEHKIRPVPNGMDLIHEVWRRVEWYILQHEYPHSLEQLVKRDMGRSRKWTNLQYDIEDVSFELGDKIFDEMVEDTLLNFADDSSYCDFNS